MSCFDYLRLSELYQVVKLAAVAAASATVFAHNRNLQTLGPVRQTAGDHRAK